MKNYLSVLFLLFGFLSGGLAYAHPGHAKPHCDPWLAPRPIPTPPPTGPGDFTAPDPGPETPPPVPIVPGQGVSHAYGDCDDTPPETPTPSPTPPPSSTPPPVPSETPEPEEPKQNTDPGQAFLEGSGKLGCSLHSVGGPSATYLTLLGPGLAAPLFWRRKRRG